MSATKKSLPMLSVEARRIYDRRLNSGVGKVRQSELHSGTRVAKKTTATRKRPNTR